MTGMPSMSLPQLRPTPLEKSYWVADNFLAGPTPVTFRSPRTLDNLRALHSAGVRRIIALLSDDEVLLEVKDQLPDACFQVTRFPVVDGTAPSCREMRVILDAIDTALHERQTVYLHCMGGRGRTGTVVGCWFARHGLAGGHAALKRLSDLRDLYGLLDPSPETAAQRARVRNWKG